MSYNVENNAGAESTLENKYLTFPLEDKTLAIEVKYVTEIIGIQAITFVPKVPDYVEGVINLRGNIIPVINIRTKFGIEKVEYTSRTSIIVLNIEGETIGIIVDKVKEVLNISPEYISAYTSGKKKKEDIYIQSIARVNDDVKLVVDCNKLLKDNV